ncbi:lipocalin family protein [Flavobacterium microcysteis]|uniref:Uncharacterized protein n=1 Tax=Flavobacterium microcysteis TaxID=2596891 RepID=A0A501QMS4_9FLAO|nr:lipocalin family protein [Flavobacterium microcysteis]TPD73386.1 hypothetical protein FJA49_01475 [Flavobacterium microcysteis]
MKNIFRVSFGLIVLFTVISCSKKETGPELNGTWELRHIAGIQVAGANPNLKAGNGNYFKFDGQNFERYTDGKKTESGSFSITPEDNVAINDKKANYSIKFNNEEKVYILLSDKTLVLFNGIIAADGTEFTYEKQ